MPHALQIASSISAGEFESLTRPLIGLPVSCPWRGCGSAIFLELGSLARRPSRGSRGEASIMIEWSWRVERRRGIRFGSWSGSRKITLGISSLQDHLIEEISLVGRLPEISIRLSGATWLHSFMTAEGQPAWVVFLPDRTWLTVRRGRIVRERSD
jgi:hypothetical protein